VQSATGNIHAKFVLTRQDSEIFISRVLFHDEFI